MRNEHPIAYKAYNVTFLKCPTSENKVKHEIQTEFEFWVSRFNEWACVHTKD